MKKVVFITTLAWRNIWRNRTRSLVVLGAVAIGIMAGLSVLGLYRGMMKSRIQKLIREETGHLQLHHRLYSSQSEGIFPIAGADSVVKILRKKTGVQAVAPRTVLQGMLASTTGTAGVKIIGMDAEQEYRVSQLDKKIRKGVGTDKRKPQPILIGGQLSEKLKIDIGSRIVLTFTDTANNLVSSAHRICGIYASGNRQIDEAVVYVPGAVVNELLQAPSLVNEIAVLLNNDDAVEHYKDSLARSFSSLHTETWKELSPETALMVNTVDDYSYIVIIILLLALAFGIINTMLMSVMERTKEFGMMMALGTSTRFITLMTLVETILLSIVGIPAGIGAAWLLTEHYETVGIDFSGTGREMMASFGFSTVLYPEFPWEKVPALLGMTFSIALISWILPALRVIRMKPVDALRR